MLLGITGITVVCKTMESFCCFIFKNKKQVKIVQEDEDGNKDIINCGHPVELISTLLRKLGGAASVNQLCQVRKDSACYNVYVSMPCNVIVALPLDSGPSLLSFCGTLLCYSLLLIS